MRIYHDCRIRHRAMSCTIEGLQGVTVNGSKPAQRAACDKVAEPPQSMAVSPMNERPFRPVRKWFGSSRHPYACGVVDTATFAVCVPV